MKTNQCVPSAALNWLCSSGPHHCWRHEAKLEELQWLMPLNQVRARQWTTSRQSGAGRLCRWEDRRSSRSRGGGASLRLRAQMKIRVPLNGSVLLRIATFRSSAAALYRGPHGCDSIWKKKQLSIWTDSSFVSHSGGDYRHRHAWLKGSRQCVADFYLVFVLKRPSLLQYCTLTLKVHCCEI